MSAVARVRKKHGPIRIILFAYITDPWGTRIELIERAPLGPAVN